MKTEDVNHLVERLGGGDREALDSLMGLVYAELHGMARAVLRSEKPEVRTRPTSLVNQLYLELQGQGRIQATGREHFFCIAAYLMRQILVAQARRRSRGKRGGDAQMVPWSEEIENAIGFDPGADRVLALDAALTRLEAFDREKARVVELRYFADLSIEATAEAMGLSPATVKRHWSVARLWLARELTNGERE
jgi:RNA polymerase sigma-70 factor (ECF subfamily)